MLTLEAELEIAIKEAYSVSEEKVPPGAVLLGAVNSSNSGTIRYYKTDKGYIYTSETQCIFAKQMEEAQKRRKEQERERYSKRFAGW